MARCCSFGSAGSNRTCLQGRRRNRRDAEVGAQLFQPSMVLDLQPYFAGRPLRSRGRTAFEQDWPSKLAGERAREAIVAAADAKHPVCAGYALDAN